MRTLRFAVGALLITSAFATHAFAQKRGLTQADWDRWRSIQGAVLSNDGKWVAYTLQPQVGDGEFVVRSTTGTTEYHVPVGYIGRPNNVPGGERARGGGPGAPGGRGGGRGGFGAGGPPSPFSADSRYAFATVQPDKNAYEREQRAAAARRGGGGGGGGGARGGAAQNGQENAAQNTIVMISLADGKQTTLPGARSFRLPKDNGKWLVFGVGSDSAAGDTASGQGGRSGGRSGRGGRGAAPGGNRRVYGTPIVLRDLQTGTDEPIADVASYEFDDSAKVLAYIVESHDSTKDGVFLKTLGAPDAKTVVSGPGNYRALTFNHAQQQFTFISDKDEFGRPDAKSTIYLATVKTGAADPVVRPDMLPAGMHLPPTDVANFTRTGNALLFTVAPPPDDSVPTDSLVGKAVFDLWNYKDPELQPQQKLQVNQARNPAFEAIYNLTTKKVVQLADDSFPQVSISDDAKTGVSTTRGPYMVESMWGDGGTDVYAIDPATGARKQVAKKINGQATLSTGGKYIAWYDNEHWFTYNFATGKTTDVTGPVKGVHFEQETWSTPNEPGAWGIAGWTKDDRSVLINDRFDIWDVDPNGGRAAVVLTDSLGRRTSTTLRLINLERDPEERAIDTSKPVWLSAFSEETKASGFYRTKLDGRHAPEKVVMGELRYGPPSKAKNADEYLVTKQTFVEFPNLWVGPNLTTLNKVSDANPWQSEYNWGTAELVTWTSGDGVPLQGILYKPENFDPNKKYPMISYFYEDLSDGLYGYIPPTGRNVINPTHYVSNGYLVFEPDIHYEIGHPGQSALKSIVPGVQKLLERPYVDPKKLGLQGHSWGGYQTAYLVTQTHMFAAAMAGAPVADMFSAYGGIRWGTGINRSVQYENGQSRIGKSIWDAPMLYMENSPLFWLPNVQTPLFMMANDADDAVPWYQGIEMFVGLRRLGKEAYLIDYNNDVHNPASRANQKDIAMRMQQFFDNKLMGAPEPEWMAKGIPAKDKGKDQMTPVVHP